MDNNATAQECNTAATDQSAPPQGEEHTNSRGFRVLSLPAEIRVMIYEQTPVIHGDIEVRPNGPSPRLPALLQVNKEIRREALDIYYMKNSTYTHEQTG